MSCAVRLAEPEEHLIVCEGLETGLAIAGECDIAVWCSLTAGNMERIAIPPQVTRVVIAADKDRSGRGELAANAFAQRFEGIRVQIATPPGPIAEGSKGQDWLDEINERARS